MSMFLYSLAFLFWPLAELWSPMQFKYQEAERAKVEALMEQKQHPACVGQYIIPEESAVTLLAAEMWENS